MKKLLIAWMTALLVACLAAYAMAEAGVLTLPPTLTRVEAEAFRGDTDIKKVVLPEGMTTIDALAFAESGLLEINLPKSITQIADDAFAGCPAALTADVHGGSYAHTWCLSHGIKVRVMSWTGSEGPSPSVNDIISGIRELNDKYADSNGYISASDQAKVITEVGAYIQILNAQGIVDEYTIDADIICFRYAKTGITFGYTPIRKGVMSGGEGVTLKIWDLQPYKTTGHVLTSRNEALSSLLYLSDGLYETPKTYADSAVTLSVIESFSSNQVILWNGHGTYTSSGKSVLSTGQAVLEEYYMDPSNPVYKLNTKKQIMFMCGSSPEERIYVNSSYIANNCSNLKGSFVYLGACNSMQDRSLSRAFINKGAAAVVGYTETVANVYHDDIFLATTQKMMQIDTDTGLYPTLSQALDYAKKTHGASDPYNKEHAEPVIEGDGNYRFIERLNLSGHVLDDEDGTPVKGASITLKWTVLQQPKALILETNQTGKFTANLYENRYDVTITAEGYEPYSGEIRLHRSGTSGNEIRLKVIQSTISGRVTDADTGEAISGADVTLTDENDRFLSHETSDASGLYNFPVAPGSYRVHAGKTGYDSNVAAVTVQKGRPLTHDIALKPVKVSVTFIVEEEVYLIQEVLPGTPVPRPADPEDIPGGFFRGWTAGGESAWDFSTPVTGNMNLYALWDIDWPHIVSGRVFEPLTNRTVPGATVELHRGFREYDYTVGDFNTLEVNGFRSENYEETPIDTTVADDAGSFVLFIPEDDGPTSNGRYIYTIVASKEGWMTSYTVIYGSSTLPEEGFGVQAAPLAPEGSLIHITGYFREYQQESAIQHLSPYATTGYITVHGWYDNPWYMYTEVYVYYNDELVYRRKAQSRDGDYWHVCRIINGRLYSIDTRSNSSNYNYPIIKSEEEELLNRQLIYPSWLRK